MIALVVGASGATGRLLVRQLLDRGVHVRAVVRSPERLLAGLPDHERLSIVRANLPSPDEAAMAEYVDGCDAIVSCLGHSLSFRGIFLPPHRLVTDVVRGLCGAVRKRRPSRPIRFVLMSSAGVRSRDREEPVPLLHATALVLLRRLVPPHADNEQAAEFLRAGVGRTDPAIEWAVVRPDTLIDESKVSPYDVHPSPTRSALLHPGRTSRINVAHFLGELVTVDATWEAWKGGMPVLYNREDAR